MANPNTNSAEVNPATGPQSGDIIEISSITGEGAPVSDSGESLEFTSLAQVRAPIEMQLAGELVNKKGLPVKVRGKENSLIEGRLVEWKNDSQFRVVWKENGGIVTDIFNAKDLYEIEGNEKLEGAVEFLRQNKEEADREGSQVRDMLSSVLESKAA